MKQNEPKKLKINKINNRKRKENSLKQLNNPNKW